MRFMAVPRGRYGRSKDMRLTSAGILINYLFFVFKAPLDHGI